MPDTISVALYRIPQLLTLARFLVFSPYSTHMLYELAFDLCQVGTLCDRIGDHDSATSYEPFVHRIRGGLVLLSFLPTHVLGDYCSAKLVKCFMARAVL